MRLDGDDWARCFREFKRSAFRLEAQPVYTMADEQDEIRDFLAGKLPPDGYHYGWLDTVAEAAEQGRPIQRVRVVTQPLNDYVRYEFAYGYDYNGPAGEDIRIADVTNGNPGIPSEDFWLFDEATVVQMLYRPDGTQIGRELIESPDLSQYLAWRDFALAHSVPYAEYQH